MIRPIRTLAVWAALAAAAPAAAQDVPVGSPDASFELTTAAGVAALRGEWRYADVKPIETEFRSVGADRRPSGPPNRAWDFTPHAGAADFDDSSWPVIAPGTLEERRGAGKLSFAWYRIGLTVPARVGDFDPTGATAVFEITVDDYAEVWVDGRLTRQLGQRGGSLVAGWNAPNRLVVGRDLRPGQRIQLAVFAINGPISEPPANYIWVRSARLDFYRPQPTQVLARVGEIERLDAALDAVVAPGAQLEKLADGFQFTEGPVWTDGGLLFSDPNTNVIYRWSESSGVQVYRRHSGYAGADVGRLRQPGSNGLALDPQGRLTVAEHGNRRVTRTEADGSITVLADRYRGKRLNSPNDLVYRSDGTLYFTDPPFGLPGFHEDPERELAVTGVYSLRGGELRLESDALSGPNGLAFSPDERFLYVSNWDEKRKVILRFEVARDGRLGKGRVFFDMTAAPGEEALDGLKVDRAGNLYSSGPGGVWILSPQGKHLGTLRGPELPANLAWGDPDGRTLYLTARSGLYRLRTLVSGAGSTLSASR